jgi:hypothetical protein
LARVVFLPAGQIEGQTAATLFFHLLPQRAAEQAAATILMPAQMAGLAAALLIHLLFLAPAYQGKDLRVEQAIMQAPQLIIQVAVAEPQVLGDQQQPQA